VNPNGLHHRLARAADRGLLAGFDCSSADSRLESFVRQTALDLHLATQLQDDVRLLVFLQSDGALVACGLHKRNQRLLDPDGELVPGTQLVVIAIANRFRDSSAPDGQPLIQAVIGAVFADIRSRHRGPWVSMMVRPNNSDGHALVTRLGAEQDGVSDGDDVFVLELG
jgi:hypothetical protein